MTAAETLMMKKQKAADTPILKTRSIAGAAVIGRQCRQWRREVLSTPVMGCAQIDHTLYGLVRPPGALPGALSGRSQPRGAMTFPLRPSDYPFVSFASGCIPDKTVPGCIRPQRLLVPSVLYCFPKREQRRAAWG